MPTDCNNFSSTKLQKKLKSHRTRDYQKTKFYRWETTLLAKPVKLKTFDQLQDLLERIWTEEARWHDHLLTVAKPELFVIDNSFGKDTTGQFDARTNQILIRCDNMLNTILCHELAHALVQYKKGIASHGHEFATMYIYLQTAYNKEELKPEFNTFSSMLNSAELAGIRVGPKVEKSQKIPDAPPKKRHNIPTVLFV